MNITKNTILITGGTSGIGRALAEFFHQQGNKVIIAGRRQELLDEIAAANSGLKGIQLDLSDPDAVDIFAKNICEQYPDLNILFNNAGISRREDLTSDRVDLPITRSIIETNIFSVIQLTTALLPILKQQAESTIITTTSALAFVPFAAYPTYCASKAFLHSWLQSLRFQLRETKVKVLELAPPYVQTELTGPNQATDPYAMPLTDFISEVTQILSGQAALQGEILVERVIKDRWAERNDEYEKRFLSHNR